MRITVSEGGFLIWIKWTHSSTYKGVLGIKC